MEPKPFSCAHSSYDLQIFPAATTNLRSVPSEMKVPQLESFFLGGSSACTALAFGHIAIFKLILRTPQYTLFFFCKNIVFPAQAEYSYFSADFRLKIFLYYS